MSDDDYYCDECYHSLIIRRDYSMSKTMTSDDDDVMMNNDNDYDDDEFV